MTSPTENAPATAGDRPSRHFIQQRIDADLAEGRNEGRVHTRFPPEPNGYLHVGHAWAILLNHEIAQEFGGHFNLRFDDTNPAAEEQEYVDAIIEDIGWLGADWEDRLFFASDYFEQLFDWASELILQGHAYVDDLPVEEMRAQRGGPDTPGTNSPYRDRSPEENIDLFRRMRAGEFAEGSRVVRAKIDMAHENLLMRDPVLYRILDVTHHRQGDMWCIYPTYDWAHGQGDAIEGITHSLCSLEFVNHRPLYDWCLDRIQPEHRPVQIEFARLNLTYTTTSKRVLRPLVESGSVSDWDDPRMPTVRGMRRRGYTPEAIREFCRKVGVTRVNSTRDFAVLEDCLRADLNRRAQRRMGVLDPLKVVITSLPEGHRQELAAVNNPEDEAAGTRPLAFTRELWIERDDFREDAPKKFFRLVPGGEVRLRYAYVIRCDEVVKDDAGEVVELRCTHLPETLGGQKPADGHKVKGVVHWVSVEDAIDATVRLYDHLFRAEQPGAETGDPADDLNPDSLRELTGAKLEPAVASHDPEFPFQLERLGYFRHDPRDSSEGRVVLNRTVTLRDTWAKVSRKG